MISGDILSMKVDNPNLGSRTLFPVANTDSTIDYGGFKANDDKNSIDGGGRPIDRRNRARWSAKMTVSWNMTDTNGDELSYITALLQDMSQSTFTISHINGSVWSGQGVLVGENTGAGQDAQIEVTAMGGGILSKVA